MKEEIVLSDNGGTERTAYMAVHVFGTIPFAGTGIMLACDNPVMQATSINPSIWYCEEEGNRLVHW